MVIVSLFIASDVIRGRIRWYLVAWLTVAILAFAKLPPWAVQPTRPTLPNWLWQIVLLASGIALAVRPLISYRPHRGLPDLDPDTPDLTMVAASAAGGREG